MNAQHDLSRPATRPAIVTLLGFGEAGSALASGWMDSWQAGGQNDGQTPDLRAYDIKTESDDACVCTEMQDRYRVTRVNGAARLETALDKADLVISLVTADQAEAAARAASPHLAKDTLYVDCNSCAPQTKTVAAKHVEAAHARYVDAAIMAPIHPRRHETPMLLAGPHAGAAQAALGTLGMLCEVAGDTIGQASATKMLRSVMIKGIEALTLESLLAARAAGVEEAIIASLNATMPGVAGVDWAARAAYNMERTTTHGLRRASEMREAAATVESLGITPRMAKATAAWQQEMGDLHLTQSADVPQMTFQERADAIRAAQVNVNRRKP